MIYICNSCLVAAAVLSPDAQELNDHYPCPWCGEGLLLADPVLGRAALEGASPYRLIHITRDDFVRAVAGVGLPGEYGAPRDVVLDLLRHGRIVGVDLSAVGTPEKTVIHSLALRYDDLVVVLHLGASTHGAVVYRLEELNAGGSNRPGEPVAPGAQAGPDPVPAAADGGGDGEAGGAPADVGPDGLPGMPGVDPVSS